MLKVSRRWRRSSPTWPAGPARRTRRRGLAVGDRPDHRRGRSRCRAGRTAARRSPTRGRSSRPAVDHTLRSTTARRGGRPAARRDPQASIVVIAPAAGGRSGTRRRGRPPRTASRIDEASDRASRPSVAEGEPRASATPCQSGGDRRAAARRPAAGSTGKNAPLNRNSGVITKRYKGGEAAVVLLGGRVGHDRRRERETGQDRDRDHQDAQRRCGGPNTTITMTNAVRDEGQPERDPDRAARTTIPGGDRGRQHRRGTSGPR